MMGQFLFGIFIMAIAAALAAVLGWYGKQVAEEGWRKWKAPATIVHQNTKQLLPDPIIKCSLEHPVMMDESPPRIDKRNPDAILYNDGAVSAVSLKVDLWVLSFQKGQVASAGNYGRAPHGHLFAVEELKPFQQVKESIHGVSGSEMAVYIFDMAFNQKENLKGYERRDMFFVEKGMIYTAGEFETREDYKTLTLAINKFMIEKNAMPKTTFRGTNQHAWIVDPDPRHDIKLNEDGSASLRLHFSDIAQLKRHYQAIDRPYLRLSPIRFKDSNTYLKAQFDQNTGTINFMIEVINEGNGAAIDVRQDFPAKSQAPSNTGSLAQGEAVTIPPGERKFLRQEVTLTRLPSSAPDAAPYQGSAGINFEESPLLIKTTVHYSFEGDIQSHYRTTITYELKENSVKLVGADYE